MKYWIIPPVADVRKAWIEKISRHPDFAGHEGWEEEEWEFQVEEGQEISAEDVKDKLLNATYRVPFHTKNTP